MESIARAIADALIGNLPRRALTEEQVRGRFRSLRLRSEERAKRYRRLNDYRHQWPRTKA